MQKRFKEKTTVPHRNANVKGAGAAAKRFNCSGTGLHAMLIWKTEGNMGNICFIHMQSFQQSMIYCDSRDKGNRLGLDGSAEGAARLTPRSCRVEGDREQLRRITAAAELAG